MKEIAVMIAMSLVFLLNSAVLFGQESTAGVKKQAGDANENADNLNGKKIQQQSLTNTQFEKLDTIAAKPVQKKKSKNKTRHQ